MTTRKNRTQKLQEVLGQKPPEGISMNTETRIVPTVDIGGLGSMDRIQRDRSALSAQKATLKDQWEATQAFLKAEYVQLGQEDSEILKEQLETIRYAEAIKGVLGKG